MKLVESEVASHFIYTRPRRKLQEEGVAAGTILFDGKRTHMGYEGTAFIFSKNCGRTPYKVTGDMGTDKRTVTLRGHAPRLNASCRVIGVRDDELLFTLGAVRED
jgi:hypothetical protein